MSNTEIPSLRKWVEIWKKSAPELHRIRINELMSSRVPSTVELLEDAFQSALRFNPPKPSSGLVEQQRWFMKMKE